MKFKFFIASLLFILLFSSFSVLAGEEVVMKINGEKIYRKEIEEPLKNLEKLFGQEMKNKALAAFIESKLIEQESKKLNIKVSEEEIKEGIKNSRNIVMIPLPQEVEEARNQRLKEVVIMNIRRRKLKELVTKDVDFQDEKEKVYKKWKKGVVKKAKLEFIDREYYLSKEVLLFEHLLAL